MQIATTIILLLIGFILLVKSSDLFVDAVSSIATNFKMSKLMIALTIAAFGTCAPELAISFQSISSGNGDIALANVIGSNVVNILLVIGLAACIKPIKVREEVTKKELPILLVVTSLFVLSIVTHFLGESNINFSLNRQDGILFVSLFAMFIFYIISVIKAKQGFFEFEKPKYKLVKAIIITIISCLIIVFSSDLVVNNAQKLATELNISTKIITMFIVVIGTSLPEMTMTVIAARKSEFDIALGNIIGTNIFNIGIVLGLPLLIFGGITSIDVNIIDILAVHIAAFALFFFAKNDKVISRKEGTIMIILFILYYSYILAF